MTDSCPSRTVDGQNDPEEPQPRPIKPIVRLTDLFLFLALLEIATSLLWFTDSLAGVGICLSGAAVTYFAARQLGELERLVLPTGIENSTRSAGTGLADKSVGKLIGLAPGGRID